MYEKPPMSGASSVGQARGLDNRCCNIYYRLMPKGLQAELKQSIPFRSPATEAMLSILRTAAVIEHGMGEELKRFGVTGAQHNVLRILRGAGQKGLCGREIGERMVARVPDVPRMLDRMETLKLISRERDAEDRRHVTARITQKGLDLLKEIDPAIDQAERARFSGLNPKQIQEIIDGLAAVREAF